MREYQESLNKIVKSCCPNCTTNGCKDCSIEKICNATAKQWVDTLQKLIDQTKTLKLEEVIKEWEEKGFEVENNDKSISFRNTKLNIDIYVDKLSKEIQICVCHYNYAQTISFEFHNLLSKTLKMLEVEDDDKETPKKPIIKNVCNEVDGDVDYGACPNCEYPLDYSFNYCPECSQALDWSDEDE